MESGKLQNPKTKNKKWKIKNRFPHFPFSVFHFSLI